LGDSRITTPKPPVPKTTPIEGVGVTVGGRGVAVDRISVGISVEVGAGVAVEVGATVTVGVVVGGGNSVVGVALGAPINIDPPILSRLRKTIKLIVTTAKA
jgi:hypothetical protein